MVEVVARSWRRWQREGAELFKGGAGLAACSGVRTHSAYCAEDRGDSSNAVLGWFESTVEVPQTQFIDDVAPSFLTETEIPQAQFLDKVVGERGCARRCSASTVVDEPVVLQSVLHALSTEAFGRIVHMFYVLAQFSLENLESFPRAPCI